MASNDLDELTVNELLEIAKDCDITGRHDMTKDELIYAINQARPDEESDEEADEESDEEAEEESDEEAEEESDEEAEEESDEIEELPWDVADAEVGDEVMVHLSRPMTITAINEGNPYEVEMETNRGGRHMLRVKADETRLMRWRAGDEEWMYNATYPEQFSLPDTDVYEYKTDHKLPLSVADDEDEAGSMAIMQIDKGDLDVEVIDVEQTDDNWIVTLKGVGEVTGFETSPDDLDIGDF